MACSDSEKDASRPRLGKGVNGAGTADLCGMLTPEDVLRKFAAVKVYHTAKGPVVSDIPKDVREISEAIGFGLARWAEPGAE